MTLSSAEVATPTVGYVSLLISLAFEKEGRSGSIAAGKAIVL
jgi:hypothetical protein